MKTDELFLNGQLDRAQVATHLAQVVAMRKFRKTPADLPGFSFDVLLGTIQEKRVTFSLPQGLTPMRKFSVPFTVTWLTPTGETGYETGIEQLFIDA
jgi:hypothetical protein